MINVVYGCLLRPLTGVKKYFAITMAKLFGWIEYSVIDPIENKAYCFGSTKESKKKAYDYAFVWSEINQTTYTVIETPCW